MNNKIRERQNLTLKYEFKIIIFSHWFLYMTFSCKLQYQLSMNRERKTIALITCQVKYNSKENTEEQEENTNISKK